jgi:hypothetical protein
MHALPITHDVEPDLATRLAALRDVVRVRGGVNVNVRLVTIGAAAPFFYEGRRGRYANLLERRARRAGRACPRTRYNPYRGIATRK